MSKTLAPASEPKPRAVREPSGESGPTAELRPRGAQITALLARFGTRRWIAGLLGAVVLIPGLAFAVYRCNTSAPKAEPPPSPEIALGDFRCQTDCSQGGPALAATFSLHVVLLPHTDADARKRLATHKLRVRQDIEQLLRRAHRADFEDPDLAGLKRQIQAQVNQTLGLRSIAEVIVTDLRFQSTARRL